VEKVAYTVRLTTNLGWDSPDDSAVVYAVACEGGSMPAGVSVCAACRAITKTGPALQRRIDRARDSLENLICLEALVAGKPMPAEIVKRNVKKKDHFTKLPDNEAIIEKLKQKISGTHTDFQSEIFVLRRKLVLADVANYNKPELKASAEVKAFYSTATKDGFTNANVKHFVQQFADGKITHDHALLGMIVSWAQIDRKVHGGVTTVGCHRRRHRDEPGGGGEVTWFLYRHM
jgi:hypothetical protein